MYSTPAHPLSVYQPSISCSSEGVCIIHQAQYVTWYTRCGHDVHFIDSQNKSTGNDALDREMRPVIHDCSREGASPTDHLQWPVEFDAQPSPRWDLAHSGCLEQRKPATGFHCSAPQTPLHPSSDRTYRNGLFRTCRCGGFDAPFTGPAGPKPITFSKGLRIHDSGTSMATTLNTRAGRN